METINTAKYFNIDIDSAQALLAVSLSSLTLLRPLYDPTGDKVSDFVMEYLNPAGQRMLQLPQQPEKTFLAYFPSAQATGAFDFYCRVLETGVAAQFEVNYQHDGIENYFIVAAHRHGELLSVSFTDTAEQPRYQVEAALREAQAREQRALAEAEAQRPLLESVFTQAPVGISLFQGDEFVVSMANEQICAMWCRSPTQVLHKPLLDALPELQGQGFEHLLAEVIPCIRNRSHLPQPALPAENPLRKWSIRRPVLQFDVQAFARPTQLH